MNVLQELKEAVITGRRDVAISLVENALAEGSAAEVIISEALMPAMEVVGDKFSRQEYFLPEMIAAAHAMKAAMAELDPLLKGETRETIAACVIGTVQGDLHDIGKNLVALMLEGGGFKVLDLGVDVSPEQFLDAVVEHRPQLVGLSALLSTTMPVMRDVINLLERAGVRGTVKVMIGGAPVTQQYADNVGANGYAPDAPSAVRLAKSLLGLAPLERN